MSNKRLHPERVIQITAILLLIATWALGLAGFFFRDSRLYAWAGLVLSVTLVVALTPITAFAVVLVIERIRGERPE